MCPTGRMGRMAIDSVLLIGFGGPRAPGEILPFLRRVTEGRGIPEARLEQIARHYEMVGGGSPYNDLTGDQARALERHLAQAGAALPVRAGMRNWHPLLAETIRLMARDGLRRAAGVILAPHRSEPSWGRYVAAARQAAEQVSREGAGFSIQFIEPWFDDPGFLEAGAQRIEQASGHRRGAWPEALPLVFTAHSIPLQAAADSPYVQDLMASCRGVAGLLGASDWRLAYQSRSGDPATPWLGPDIGELLRDLAAAGAAEVVAQGIGFLCDHVELLYDLDIEAAQVAREHGMKLLRAPCVGDHPEFIRMLSQRVLRVAGPDAAS